MKRILLIAAVMAVSAACATSSHQGHDHSSPRYRACVERIVGGRVLHDPGWVVEEEMDAATGNRVYRFLSTYWNRVIDVTRVNRFCSMLSSLMDPASPQPSTMFEPM